jgi:hypothetical protein
MTRCRRKRTIPEAAYAFSIIRDHPYYDANRRTGLMAALVFLGLNGCGNHKYHEPLLQEAVFYLADQKLTRVEFADYLRHAYDGGLREPGERLTPGLKTGAMLSWPTRSPTGRS